MLEKNINFSTSYIMLFNSIHLKFYIKLVSFTIYQILSQIEDEYLEKRSMCSCKTSLEKLCQDQMNSSGPH